MAHDTFMVHMRVSEGRESFWKRKGDRERERETDRQTDREIEIDR